MEKTRIAIIGGTGFEQIVKNANQTQIETPYGVVKPLSFGEIGGKKIIFLPRHGTSHSIPPHKVNYRANVYALYKEGVERIIALSAVGAINRVFRPGEIVVPHDFVDFTKLRTTTFYDEAPVTHIDVSEPYCPEMRKLLVKTAKKLGIHIEENAVLACTEGPRFETPAEIKMLERLGCDVVGMTGAPEAVLARELEICYVAVCFVSNMAAGIQERLTPLEVSKISEKVLPKVEQLLIDTIRDLPLEREGNCPCASALKDARFK